VSGNRWRAVAALVDPVRRALYEYVRRADHPVSREEAADAHAISRNLSAFHLDKLVEADLLRARYMAPPDQPRGRGRTPKVYEAQPDGLTLTVPPRRHEFVGEILADAVAECPTDAGTDARARAADRGRQLGHEYQTTARTGSAQLTAVEAALNDFGFEPRAGEFGTLTLSNCPFHPLARRQPELICGLNLAFLDGLLQGLGATDVRAQLDPQPDTCCVTIGPS
jgi:predicted ArsR family transcriptional regulator